MATIAELLRSAAAQALGWTLLHSLWQGLICFLLCLAILRLIPIRKSALRYFLSVSAVSLMLVSSVVTFCTIYSPDILPQHFTVVTAVSTESQPVAHAFSLSTLLQHITRLLDHQIGIVSACWLIGAMFFLLRVLSGYWYIGLVRRSAVPVGALWQQQVDALAAKLNVNKYVYVAQSNLISAPWVLGYLKPVILVPVGMLSGLTTEELEAIFIHELMHIRRRDYLVNLVQSILEALYFFNPFVWLLSAAIRREREHCCDDGVVSNSGNAIAYIRALATLEEVKLTRSSMALSLAEDNNLLLQRIKRIMEKSVHHYSYRDRLVPAALLLIGLMCASWLTIQSRDRKRSTAVSTENSGTARAILLQDTTDKEKPGAYYHYSVTTIDAEGKEDTRVVEGYSSDNDNGSREISPVELPEPIEPIEPIVIELPIEEMILGIDPMRAPGLMMPPPGPASVLPQMPHVFASPMRIEIPAHFGFRFDTIPFNGDGSMEGFGHEFDETFRHTFEEFRAAHEEEMSLMMKELEERFGSTEEFERADQLQMQSDEMQKRGQERMRSAEELARRGEQSQRESLRHMEDAHRSMEVARLRATTDQARMLDMSELNKEMERLNESLRHLNKRLQDAQEQVQEEAIKDGYLKKGETINSIHIRDDSMEINGRKVKAADAKKYREIMDGAELESDRD